MDREHAHTRLRMAQPLKVTQLKQLEYLLLAAVIVVAIAARIIPGTRTIDDAFITFRYSRNIVEGQGFVYNPGSQVLGTTTPLFTVLMAAISVITGGQDFPYYAIAVSALADGGTAVLLFLLTRRLTGSTWLGTVFGVLWGVAPQSVTFAIGGMETSLNIFWMIGAIWLYINDRPLWMGAFAALGVLTRIDAVIWIAPLFLYQLVECWRVEVQKPFLQRIPLRTWIAFGVVLLPWLVFSSSYFGSPFPRSLTAKSVAYVMPPGAGFVRFVQMYSTPFFEFDTFGAQGAMVASVVYTVLSVMGILYVRRQMPRLLPFLIYPYLYMAIFSIANPLIFRWYTAPPMPAWMLSIILGLVALQQSLHLKAPVLTMIIPLVWIFTSLNAWTFHPDHGLDRPAPKMAWHQIELYYEEMATRLREKYGVTPDTRVASADIGAIGYFSRAIIVDTVGLVTPELSKYYPVPPSIIPEGQNYAIPPQLITDTKPEYLVTMEAFVRLGLETDQEFKANYGEPAEKIPTGFYGDDMRIYKHRN